MCIMDNGNDPPARTPFLEISDEKHNSNKINSGLMYYDLMFYYIPVSISKMIIMQNIITA